MCYFIHPKSIGENDSFLPGNKNIRDWFWNQLLLFIII